jgi:hypothetical protein
MNGFWIALAGFLLVLAVAVMAFSYAMSVRLERRNSATGSFRAISGKWELVPFRFSSLDRSLWEHRRNLREADLKNIPNADKETSPKVTDTRSGVS